jgi:predicted TIM-barrel fold metal-dependent hydrolase
MVASMEQCGISMSLVAPHLAIGPNERLGNEQAYEAAASFPGRLVPYVTLNPQRGRAGVEAEIGRWEKAGIKGFKLHPAVHRYAATGEAYRPVYEYAAAHGLAVLVHCWEGDAWASPSTLAGLAEEYPGAYFIIGHAASSWGSVETSCAEAKRHSNLYLDLTGSGLWYGALEYMVAHGDVERILFGSDNPFLDPRPPLGRVLMARVGDDVKRLILGLNAKRLFGL